MWVVALLSAGFAVQPEAGRFSDLSAPGPFAPALLPPVPVQMIPAQAAPTQLADLVIGNRVIIRMPVKRNERETKHPVPQRWIEKDSAKCLSVTDVGGAILSGDDSIDLVVRGGDRWRMRFSSECPALGFYQGFYFRPDKEGKLCARRDVVYARSGGECTVWSIRKLVEKRPRKP